jgi:hypothetical protein
MAAQPSIFVVAPIGTAKDAYSRGTPRFCSVTRCVSGMVPTDERDTKASWIAGHAPEKNLSGLSPCDQASSG